MTSQGGERASPVDVQGVIARIDDAWRALLEALDGIPDDRLEELGAIGEWSLKDLFGHIAFWDEWAISELDRVLAGEPAEERDWQAMNEADAARRRDRTLPEQRADMHQAHAALLERLAEIAGLEAAAIDDAIKGATYEHYEEHIPDIRAWRERAGI
jgi:hypothetical protein